MLAAHRMIVAAKGRARGYLHRAITLGVCVILLGLPVAACTGKSSDNPISTLVQVLTATPTSETAPVFAASPNPSAVPTSEAGPTAPPQSKPPDPALLPDERHSLPSSLSIAPSYTITLSVDYAAHTFQGQEALNYTNAENTSLDSLYFRLFPNGKGSYGNGSLTVSRVSVDGQPAPTELSLNDTVLKVQLPGTLQERREARLEFEFSGVVPTDFGGQATPSGYGIYNYSDGVLALSGWYPILSVYDDEGWNLDPISDIGDSVYSDMAFYSVDLSTSSNVVVAATGVSTSQGASGGTNHYRFISGPTRDFFLILSPDFKVSSTTVDGIRVNSYYLPGHAGPGEKAQSIAAKSISIYNRRFGPYPYTEFDVVDAPMRNAAGVEYPGIVLIGSFLYDQPERPNFTVAIAHEVGHQWWYNVVGNDVIDEPWLDEALTTYSSSLYYEDTQGKPATQGLISSWENRYQQFVSQGKDDEITGTLGHFEGLGDPGVYGAIVYSKGALFFNALRQEIGDEAFFQALRNYYQAYRFQIATANNLLDEFEKAAGRQLDDFYQEWLYTP